MAVAPLLLGVAISGCGGSGDRGYSAEYYCKEFVKDRLKAPSTADFAVSHTGVGPQYHVSGTVDAENSFGAKIRSDFTCVVRDEGDSWRLVSLTGLG